MSGAIKHGANAVSGAIKHGANAVRSNQTGSRAAVVRRREGTCFFVPERRRRRRRSSAIRTGDVRAADLQEEPTKRVEDQS